MTENEITGDILDASIKLHRQFGAGLLESVYEALKETRPQGRATEEYEGFLRFVNNFQEQPLCDSASLREVEIMRTAQR